MGPRRTHLVASLLVAALILAAFIIPLASALAQEATPQATAAAPAATAEGTQAATPPGTPGTPTPTPTPTMTPTATPTFTALQAQLVLAKTYLDGKDYAKAAALFAAIAETDRGNADALAGLKAALDGQATASAPAVVSTPPPGPSVTPAAAKAGAANTVGARLGDFGSTAVAALLVVALIYLLSAALRWLLYWLRELWLIRVRPLFHQPATQPGFLIGDFANGLGESATIVPQIVSQAIAEKLVAWNQLVHAKEATVEPAPNLDLGGMGWLKVLWSWILPPQRGYRVSGLLSQGPAGAYQLSVQRTNLARNSIDLSTTLERHGAAPEVAFRTMAGEAAKWLVAPADMAASEAIARGIQAVHVAGAERALLTPSEIFDQALELLLPVRQQVNQGAIDFNYARKQLHDATSMLDQLPEGSQLRRDLQAVITDLHHAVPAG